MRRLARITGDAPNINVTTPLGGPGQIEEMRVHLNLASATAEDLTLTLVSAEGVEYNTVLFRQDMDTVQDVVWQPARPINTFRGDALQLIWGNTNSRTYGIELIWSGLGA
jgi:hypothetical protein